MELAQADVERPIDEAADREPERILVTAGASAALQLVTLALFEPGDEVLMPDPCYPCNRHFVAATGATPRLLPTGPDTRWQPSAASVADNWGPATRGVLLAHLTAERAAWLPLAVDTDDARRYREEHDRAALRRDLGLD